MFILATNKTLRNRREVTHAHTLPPEKPFGLEFPWCQGEHKKIRAQVLPLPSLSIQAPESIPSQWGEQALFTRVASLAVRDRSFGSMNETCLDF